MLSKQQYIGVDDAYLLLNDEIYYDTDTTVGIMKRAHSELTAAIGSVKANEIVFSVGVSFGRHTVWMDVMRCVCLDSVHPYHLSISSIHILHRFATSNIIIISLSHHNHQLTNEIYEIR